MKAISKLKKKKFLNSNVLDMFLNKLHANGIMNSQINFKNYVIRQSPHEISYLYCIIKNVF